MFVTRTNSRFCIAIVMKCANSGIHAAVTNHPDGHEITNIQALDVEHCIAFFNDPVKRHMSAFNHFWTTATYGCPFDDMPADKIYVSGRGANVDYMEFTDYTLDPDNDDPHWTPQADVVSTPDGRFVPTRIHRLADCTLLWENYFKGLRPAGNSWSEVENVDFTYRADDIRARCYKDNAIFNAIPERGILVGAELQSIIERF